MEKKLHPFEESGLGISPFRFVGMEEKVIVHPGSHVQPAGTCDHCGQGIRYCCHIRSGDGKMFVVGMDCVRKLDSETNCVLSAVERAKAQLDKKKRDEARQAKWEAQAAKIRERDDAERAANGGKTLWELEQDRKQQARKKLADELYAEQGWIIDAMLADGSNFASNMAQELEARKFSQLSERCQQIIREIYGKQSGRMNSKKYQAAVEFFDARSGYNADSSEQEAQPATFSPGGVSVAV